MINTTNLRQALAHWANGFMSAYSSTVQEINSQILPHLRIHSIMGRTFFDQPELMLDSFERADRLRDGGDIELYKFVKAVQEGTITPAGRKSVFADQVKDNAALTKIGLSHELPGFLGIRQPADRAGYGFSYDKYLESEDKRIFTLFADGSVSMTEGLPSFGTEYIENENGLPPGYYFSLPIASSDVPDDKVYYSFGQRYPGASSTVYGYVKATLIPTQPWSQVDVQATLRYVDPEAYLAKIASIAPQFDRVKIKQRFDKAISLIVAAQDPAENWTVEVRNNDSKYLHITYTAQVDDAPSLVKYVINRGSFYTPLVFEDTEKLFAHFFDSDRISDQSILWSLYLKLASFDGAYWERVYEGFCLVEAGEVGTIESCVVETV